MNYKPKAVQFYSPQSKTMHGAGARCDTMLSSERGTQRCAQSPGRVADHPLSLFNACRFPHVLHRYSAKLAKLDEICRLSKPIMRHARASPCAKEQVAPFRHFPTCAGMGCLKTTHPKSKCQLLCQIQAILGMHSQYNPPAKTHKCEFSTMARPGLLRNQFSYLEVPSVGWVWDLISTWHRADALSVDSARTA